LWVLVRSCLCVIMWVGFVIFIPEFLLFLQVLWKVWFSSFSSKLLFLSNLSSKLFVNSCEFLWDFVWVQIFCAMHIALVELELKATCLCVLHSYKSCDMYELWMFSSLYKIVSLFHVAFSCYGYWMLRTNLQFDSILTKIKTQFNVCLTFS